MLIFIGIYLLSVVGMWCFYHFYNNSKVTVTAGSLPATFIPAINSIMLFLAVIYMLCEVDWDKVSLKIFNKNG